MKKKNNQLNEAADEMFWDEFHEREYGAEERYLVVNKKTGEVLANWIKLTKEKKKVKV